MALLQCNFFSQSLMRTVPIQVILPTDKSAGPGNPPPQGPFKTLYLLHGIFGDETDWVCGTRVQAWAQDRNLAVVLPAGENSFYVDHPGSSRNYGAYIGRELVDFTRRTFPLSTRREDTFAAGLSPSTDHFRRRSPEPVSLAGRPKHAMEWMSSRSSRENGEAGGLGP